MTTTPPLSAPAADAPPTLSATPTRRSLYLTLAVITALAAFLRFFRISHQAYWTDEAFTIKRIHGSFSDMLAALSDQGFPPAWYILLRSWILSIEYLISPGHWWNHLVGQAADPGAVAFSPTITRSLPAILGTLAVPAMYFLARQFTNRKPALLVALLTAVNPFLIHYSRDIKMYQATWLLVILNTTLFFQWQTTRKHLTWFPLYLATGILMTSMHSLTWFLIAMQLIFLLVRPKTSLRPATLLWFLAIVIMAIIPFCWYEFGTKWWANLASEKANFGGLGWIRESTDLSWTSLASVPCSQFLNSYWPTFPPDHIMRSWYRLGEADFDQHAARRSLPWLANLQLYVSLAFAMILVQALIPRRKTKSSSEPPVPVAPLRPWFVALWIILPPACLALTWIPKDSAWHNWIWHNIPMPPVWGPRYLGLIAPALILCLAAALRRLPSRPLRILCILFVVAASIASACSEYFLYRNPPYHRAAEIAMRYYDPQNKSALVISQCSLANTADVMAGVIHISYDLARHIRPLSDGEGGGSGAGRKHLEWGFLPQINFQLEAKDTKQSLNFIQRVRKPSEIQTLIVTDSFGDILDPADTYSNDSIAAKLGPTWRLASEERYRSYTDRLYLFTTWRTRIWQRVPTTTQPAKQNP